MSTETTMTKTTKRTTRAATTIEPVEPSPVEAHASYLARKAQLDAEAESALERAAAAALDFEMNPGAETASAAAVAKQIATNAAKRATGYAAESRPIVQAYRDLRAAQAMAAADHREFRAEAERRLGNIARALETIHDKMTEIGIIDEEQRLLVEHARQWGATAPRMAIEQTIEHFNQSLAKLRQDDLAARRRPRLHVVVPGTLDGTTAGWPGLTDDERQLAAQRAQQRIEKAETE